MKKSLLVLALFGAAGIAQAASVTLYGRVDAGFAYNYDKAGDTKSKSFKMANGLKAGSRVGVKGVEQIGDLKVGFVLENRFNIANGSANGFNKDDSGKNVVGNTLFDGQARAFVAGDFGDVQVGRFGTIGGDASLDVVFGQYALGSGSNGYGFAGVTTSKRDAAVEYNSPVFSGVQVHAMYSNAQTRDNDNSNTKGYLDQKNSHYYGLGVDYNANGLGLVAAYEETKGADKKNKGEVYNFAGSYDFDVAKVFLGYQYAKAKSGAKADAISFGKKYFKNTAGDAVKSFAAGKNQAFTLGASAPLAGGVLAGQLSHGFFKPAADANKKVTINTVAVRYAYNLSKRTELYVGAGLDQVKVKGGEKADGRQVYFGLGHNF